MHSNGKGISASALPYRRSQPSWSKATPEEVCDQIFKLARRGLSPSQIGVILRDSQGVPQVKSVTGNKILRILKTNGEWVRYRSSRTTGYRRKESLERGRGGERRDRGELRKFQGAPLTSSGLGPSIPEDMYYLIKKAVSVRKHLERNRADKDSKLSVRPLIPPFTPR